MSVSKQIPLIYTFEVDYIANVQKQSNTNDRYEIWYPLAKSSLLLTYPGGSSERIPGPKLETFYTQLPKGMTGTLNSGNYRSRSVYTGEIQIKTASGSMLPLYSYSNKRAKYLVIPFSTPGSTAKVPLGPWSGGILNAVSGRDYTTSS